MNTVNKVSGISKFLFSTLVAASAMTSTAWAEGTTVTVSSASEIKTAISTVNNASGGEINLGTVAYEYSAPLNTDADMATITNAGTYTITGGKGALLNYELEINPKKQDGTYTVKVLEDSHFTFTKLTLRDSVEMTVSGARLDSNIYQGGSSYVSVYRDSSLTISDSTIGYNPYMTKVEDPAKFLNETTPSADNKHYWNWAPTWNIYGTANIKNSTLFAYTGQGNQCGFDFRGSGTATLESSQLSCTLITVGGVEDSNRVNPSADSSNLVATLTFDGTTVKNSQYRGDNTTKNGITIGSGDYAGKLIIKNNSDVDFTVLRYNDAREIGLQVNNAKSSVEITDSVFKAPKITNAGTISVSNSVLTADAVTNNGALTVSGTSKFNTDNMTSSTDLLFGGADEKSNLEIGSVSGQGMRVTASRVNLYKANITLTDNVTVTTTGTLSKIQDSVVDMNGKTLTFNGFTVLDSYTDVSTPELPHGVTIKNGEFKVNTNHLCFQGYGHEVGADAKVVVDGSSYNSSMVNVYGTTTIYGKVAVTHGDYGYDNVGTTNTGWAYIEKSELTVSGEYASYTIENGHMFRVIHETENTVGGVMNVVKGASFSFTGSRAGTGIFFNSNIVNVDADSFFTVDSYRGNDEGGNVKGAFNSEVAGEMIVLGNVTVNKDLFTDALVLKDTAKLNAGTIKVTDLTIHAGATLNIGSSEGVALMAEVSAIEFDTLTIIATDVKVGEDLDLSSIITGSGADDVWSALDDGAEFTVVDANNPGVTYTGVYSAENGGSVSIIPEPSAFGLLAGLGAIALAVSRRRRRTR